MGHQAGPSLRHSPLLSVRSEVETQLPREAHGPWGAGGVRQRLHSCWGHRGAPRSAREGRWVGAGPPEGEMGCGLQAWARDRQQKEVTLTAGWWPCRTRERGLEPTTWEQRHGRDHLASDYVWKSEVTGSVPVGRARQATHRITSWILEEDFRVPLSLSLVW